MSLDAALKQRVRDQGPMPFVDFMHQALYAANGGYYSNPSPLFGPQGDFITAPELSPLFGHSLANQCQEALSHLQDPILFEFGAGTGRLCVDLLQRLQKLDCLPREYWILEVSAGLKTRQQALIANALPDLAPRLRWLKAWPDQAFEGVVLANEVLDAMPVERFLQTEAGLFRSYVDLDPEGQWLERFQACEDKRLLNYLTTALPKTLCPYQSEANLLLEGWLQQASAMLSRGLMLIIDYGFPRHEYYHRDRQQGSLVCHHRHRVHTNPFVHLGEQDITAHVDFTHVAEAADAAGFRVAGFTNQGSFLLANGLLSLLEGIEQEQQRLRQTQAVKQLLNPSEMGELFKVMALSKGLDQRFSGFQLRDKRASL